ncbi:MAG TPA: hypothetical protein VJM11_09425 [Nevskiaceae bacterium]|nr:hypothetical protein [Nevskiaceae bacterium]
MSASIEGKWAVTIYGPTGPQETVLDLALADGVLSGTQAAMGQVETILEATYDSASGDIFWVNKITKPLPIALKFKGTVEGDTMSGKVNAAIMGAFPFTAVRK